MPTDAQLRRFLARAARDARFYALARDRCDDVALARRINALLQTFDDLLRPDGELIAATGVEWQPLHRPEPREARPAIRVDVDFRDDGSTPVVSPAAALADFRVAARELAELMATVGDWPSMAAIAGHDAACVRDRVVCAALFARYAIAELGIARETLDTVARSLNTPNPQAKETTYDD